MAGAVAVLGLGWHHRTRIAGWVEPVDRTLWVPAWAVVAGGLIATLIAAQLPAAANVALGLVLVVVLLAIFSPVLHYWPFHGPTPDERSAQERRQIREHLGERQHGAAAILHDPNLDPAEQMRRGREFDAETADWIEGHLGTADRAIFENTHGLTAPTEYQLFFLEMTQRLQNVAQILERLG